MKRSFARNSTLNLLTQVLVSVIAFACVPTIVRLLGVEKFGLLSILWLFTGYFGLLDFGVGAASVKFLSEHFARNERREAANIFKIAVKMSLAFSSIWCVVLLIVSIIGIEHFLRISGELQTEARNTLLLLALCVPAILLQGSFRSVLYAFNRFDLVNLLQGASGLLQWTGSLIVLLFKGGLLEIVVFTVLIRYAGFVAMFFICRKLFPEPFSGTRSNEVIARAQLLKFGGWVTVSQIISPFIVFFERFIIGNVLSLAWLSFFAVPNDAIMKLVVIPMSLTTTLLPSISRSWWDEHARKGVKYTYLKSIKFTYLLMIPIVAVIVAYHNEILFHWVGVEFVSKSGLVLSLFAVGIIFHSIAQLPNATLQAIGRPDIPAKLLIMELPIYALCVYFLTQQFGIEGTAFAWTVRVVIEAVVLLGGVYFSMRSVLIPNDFSFLWKGLAMISVGMTCAVLVRNILGETAGIIVLILGLISYMVTVWYIAFDESDREIVNRLRSSLSIMQSA